LTQEEHRFLYNLSVWIYRAICEYNRLNDKSEIVCRSCFSLLDLSKKQTEGTLLDIILSLDKFNKENKDFFLFVIKNIHSGYNKINWNKTISTQQPYDRTVYPAPPDRQLLAKWRHPSARQGLSAVTACDAFSPPDVFLCEDALYASHSKPQLPAGNQDARKAAAVAQSVD
jgi:hypothetical protein